MSSSDGAACCIILVIFFIVVPLWMLVTDNANKSITTTTIKTPTTRSKPHNSKTPTTTPNSPTTRPKPHSSTTPTTTSTSSNPTATNITAFSYQERRNLSEIPLFSPFYTLEVNKKQVSLHISKNFKFFITIFFIF